MEKRMTELRALPPMDLERVYRAATGREDGGRITQQAKIAQIIEAEATPKVQAGESGEEVVEVTGPSGP